VSDADASPRPIRNNDVALLDSSSTDFPVFRMDEKLRPLLFNTIKRRSDTSYIYCTEVQFIPSTASEGEQHLSLVFPSQTSDLQSAGLSLFNVCLLPD
jgi:hypothetical protein